MAARALAAGDSPDPGRLPVLLPRALRFFLDGGKGEPGWRYPPFLAGGNAPTRQCRVPLEEALWQELQDEAGRQRVSAEELLQHAVFYYAAARDEGRLTQRIAEELSREEEGGS
jgi:hypothetical protein